jgi:L-fuconolactonase
VFESSRLMYGGDWPISIPAGGYGLVLDGVRDLLQGMSVGESNQIWSETARDVYGLDAHRWRTPLN